MKFTNRIAAFAVIAAVSQVAPLTLPLRVAQAQDVVSVKAGFIAVAYEGGKAAGRSTTSRREAETGKPRSRSPPCSPMFPPFHFLWGRGRAWFSRTAEPR